MIPCFQTVCSSVLHDLASPLSSLLTGLDLLEPGTEGNDILPILCNASQNMRIRLEYFRLMLTDCAVQVTSQDVFKKVTNYFNQENYPVLSLYLPPTWKTEVWMHSLLWGLFFLSKSTRAKALSARLEADTLTLQGLKIRDLPQKEDPNLSLFKTVLAEKKIAISISFPEPTECCLTLAAEKT
jgi:hypothetical protein